MHPWPPWFLAISSPPRRAWRGFHRKTFEAVVGCVFYTELSWPTSSTRRHATIAIGRGLARGMPQKVTVNWWKEERGERIFVDFNQMARDRLMASAYSIRPTPAGRVSAPLTWDELPSVHPDDFTLLTMPARFADLGDPWAPLYAADPASISTALEWYAADDVDGEPSCRIRPNTPRCRASRRASSRPRRTRRTGTDQAPSAPRTIIRPRTFAGWR